MNVEKRTNKGDKNWIDPKELLRRLQAVTIALAVSSSMNRRHSRQMLVTDVEDGSCSGNFEMLVTDSLH